MGKPPRLSRDNFSIWKNMMEVFLNGVDSALIDTIKEGPFIPKLLVPTSPATETTPAIAERYRPKEKEFWSEEDKKQVDVDGKARSIVTMALPDDIYHSVINCQFAKEIWDTLIVLFY